MPAIGISAVDNDDKHNEHTCDTEIESSLLIMVSLTDRLIIVNLTDFFLVRLRVVTYIFCVILIRFIRIIR